jgi:hypothetical protein
MAIRTDNVKLNDLLIALSRGLLQYVGECWPWTGLEDATVHRQIDELIARQQRGIAHLADLLARRNWPVDFGAYPTEYTDLHYVALDFLLSQLIESEESLVAELERSLVVSHGDADAASLIEDILAGEREIVQKLRALTMARAAGRSNGKAGTVVAH